MDTGSVRRVRSVRVGPFGVVLGLSIVWITIGGRPSGDYWSISLTLIATLAGLLLAGFTFVVERSPQRSRLAFEVLRHKRSLRWASALIVASSGVAVLLALRGLTYAEQPEWVRSVREHVPGFGATGLGARISATSIGVALCLVPFVATRWWRLQTADELANASVSLVRRSIGAATSRSASGRHAAEQAAIPVTVFSRVRDVVNAELADGRFEGLDCWIDAMVEIALAVAGAGALGFSAVPSPEAQCDPLDTPDIIQDLFQRNSGRKHFGAACLDGLGRLAIQPSATEHGFHAELAEAATEELIKSSVIATQQTDIARVHLESILRTVHRGLIHRPERSSSARLLEAVLHAWWRSTPSVAADDTFGSPDPMPVDGHEAPPLLELLRNPAHRPTLAMVIKDLLHEHADPTPAQWLLVINLLDAHHFATQAKDPTAAAPGDLKPATLTRVLMWLTRWRSAEDPAHRVVSGAIAQCKGRVPLPQVETDEEWATIAGVYIRADWARVQLGERLDLSPLLSHRDVTDEGLRMLLDAMSTEFERAVNELVETTQLGTRQTLQLLSEFRASLADGRLFNRQGLREGGLRTTPLIALLSALSSPRTRQAVVERDDRIGVPGDHPLPVEFPLLHGLDPRTLAEGFTGLPEDARRLGDAQSMPVLAWVEDSLTRTVNRLTSPGLAGLTAEQFEVDKVIEDRIAASALAVALSGYLFNGRDPALLTVAGMSAEDLIDRVWLDGQRVMVGSDRNATYGLAADAALQFYGGDDGVQAQTGSGGLPPPVEFGNFRAVIWLQAFARCIDGTTELQPGFVDLAARSVASGASRGRRAAVEVCRVLDKADRACLSSQVAVRIGRELGVEGPRRTETLVAALHDLRHRGGDHLLELRAELTNLLLDNAQQVGPTGVRGVGQIRHQLQSEVKDCRTCKKDWSELLVGDAVPLTDRCLASGMLTLALVKRLRAGLAIGPPSSEATSALARLSPDALVRLLPTNDSLDYVLSANVLANTGDEAGATALAGAIIEQATRLGNFIVARRMVEREMNSSRRGTTAYRRLRTVRNRLDAAQAPATNRHS